MKQETPSSRAQSPQPVKWSSGACGETFLSLAENQLPGSLLEPGTRLDRFTVVQHLGTGRTAHVYLARDEFQTTEVALKVAAFCPETTPSFEQHLTREIAMHRRLGGHPNVLTIFDVHRTQFAGLDLVLLSMEYADGHDLRTWLKQNRERLPFCRDEGIQIVVAVAQGLAAMHRGGITHSDAKPENILCVHGVWKIGDLDHACPTLAPPGVCSGPEPGAGNEPRGTPGYRGPELDDPAHFAADARADVYALGVVLREVLEMDGRRSVPCTSPAQSVISARLTRIVKRCLAPDANKRFQVLEHLIEALDLLRRGVPAHRGSQAVREQQNRWRQVLRCLDSGRTEDAQRLSQVLLATCPHHPGAHAVLRDVNRQHAQTLAQAGELGENLARLPLDEAIRQLRPIVDLAPRHEGVTTLVEALEARVNGCGDALIQSTALLQAGETDRAVEAFRRCCEFDSHSAPAAEACVVLGDLAQWLDSSQRRIEAAITQRRCCDALRMLQSHRDLLIVSAAQAQHIRRALEGAHGSRKTEDS